MTIAALMNVFSVNINVEFRFGGQNSNSDEITNNCYFYMHI